MGNEFHSHRLETDTNYNLDHFQNVGKLIDQNKASRTQLFTEPVQNYIKKNQPYKEKTTSLNTFCYAGSDLYQGPLNASGHPGGFGRLIRNDDSVIYADFSSGKAQGDGTCIFKDGSTYKGQFKQGQAEGPGVYENNTILYKGMFSKNVFNGKGELHTKGDLKYESEGEFQAGVLKNGTLHWEEKNQGNKPIECSYQGTFNKQGNFQGRGKLVNKFGKYVGTFQNGLKQGAGKFYFSNGLLYVGDYFKDNRQGKGIIYNASKVPDQKYQQRQNLIAYRGQFEDNNPHGEGQVFDPMTSSMIQTSFIEGVNQKSALFQSGSKIHPPNKAPN